MPTYEYECKTCGQVIDVFQSIKARPLSKTHCPHCDAVRSVKRLISTGGAVLFKGSGFYQTDYRSESYKSKAKSEGESKSSKPAEEGKKKPSKADAASPSKPADSASKAEKK